MLRRRLLAGIGLIAVVGLLWAQAAQAYVIFGSWQGNSATIDPDPSLPSSFYNAQGFAAGQWTNVTTSNWRFSRQIGSANDLSSESIDGSLGVLAVTTVYFSGGDIVEADVAYDSAENWYTGSGTPGSNQVDLRSVATHELGHITGLDHTQNSNCPGNSSDATMCPFYTLGSTYVRSLQADDRNGLAANYPQRPDLGGKAVIHALYPRHTDAELAGLAHVAFLGRVEAISQAQWGANGIASHEVSFRVVESIHGATSPTITLTVVGASPSGSVDGSIAGHSDHDLAAGDRVLVLATRNGSSLRFAGAPSISYARAGTDRFGSLMALVRTA